MKNVQFREKISTKKLSAEQEEVIDKEITSAGKASCPALEHLGKCLRENF